MRLLILMIFLFLLSCSNMSKNQNIVEEINFDEDLTIDDFKKKIIEYGKKSEFPDISE